MAFFYVNVRLGQELIRDPDGYSFPTAQAARDAAERTARALYLSQAGDLSGEQQIEIADATGHAVAVIHVHHAAPELCHTPTRIPCAERHADKERATAR